MGREILRMDMRRQRALDRHAHVARAALAARLRREHMFDLRRPDPEGERPERAVGRGVAVAAADRYPGLRTSLRGPDDMDDRSEAHTSELQSIMRISYAVHCFK